MKHTNYDDKIDIKKFEQEIPITHDCPPLKPCQKKSYLNYIWYFIWWLASMINLGAGIVYNIQPDIVFSVWAILTACCLLGFLITRLINKYL